MTLSEENLPQGEEHPAQVALVAERLSELLGADLDTNEVVQAVRDARQVKENKEALLRFQKGVFNAHDWSIENLSTYLTEDFVDHAAMVGDPPGLEGVKMRFTAWNAAFDQAEEDNISMVGQDDILAVLYDLHAQHTGNFMGIEPTNREVVIPGIEFVRIRDGKISEHWGIYDFLATAEEIGANLMFVKREEAGEPERPEIPWRRKMREEDADAVVEAAEAAASDSTQAGTAEVEPEPAR